MSFDQEYPKILFFSSSHCAPCEPVQEMLKKINISMFGKKLHIEKIDIEEKVNRELIQKHRVTSLPTIIIGNERLAINITREDMIDAILKAYITSVKI